MTRRRQRGIALVLVTWVFMILGILALDFARYMRDDAMAALNLAEETANYYVAVGAMNRAIYDLERDHGDRDVLLRDRRRFLASRDGGLTTSCRAGSGTCVSADEDDDTDEDDDEERSADDADDDEGLALADGEWHEDVLGEVRYGVRVSDEGGLISLNGVADPRGVGLLTFVVKNLLGLGGTASTDRRSDAAVSTIVDSILDWYDVDDHIRMHGAESAFYLARDPSYPAKNAPFDSVEELLQVRGVTPELYYGSAGMPGLRDIFTAYVPLKGDHPKVNLRRAPAAVLQALLAIDAEQAAELVELREELDPPVFIAQIETDVRALDPTVAEQNLGGGGLSVVRVEARANVALPRNQARVAAIVELSSEVSDGARVIRWFDRAPWEGALPTGSGDGPA